MFITFEGIDGSGKSTQAKLLAEYFRELGNEVSLYREPGGTTTSESIRNLLLNKDSKIDKLTEFMLMASARTQLVTERIIPDLEAGKIVICDRYTDSSEAYQGYGRGIGLEIIRNVNHIATRGLVPNITFLLDIDIDISNARRKGEKKDRIESAGGEFFRKLREGYLEIQKFYSDRVVLMNGVGEEKIIMKEIVERLNN
jgi:dTMP kinase